MTDKQTFIEKSMTSDSEKTQGKECVLGKFISESDGWKIVDAAKSWEGTPYRLVGANSVKQLGGDCSGTTNKSYVAAGFPYPYQSTANFANYVKISLRFRKIQPDKTTLQAGDIFCGLGIWQFMRPFQKETLAAIPALCCMGKRWKIICTQHSIATRVLLMGPIIFRPFVATRLLCIVT